MSASTQFQPNRILAQRHLQTILPTLLKVANPSGESERLELEDGDFIDLFWSQKRAKRCLLILHGLEGSIQSVYAKRLLNYCHQQGIATVFMHMRGCSGEPNRLLRSYHSGETDDLRFVINHLKTKLVTEICLVGYSLGGNQALKYMGEAKTDSAILGAVAISVPFRLDLCADTLNSGFAKIYQNRLLKTLIEKAMHKNHLFEQSGLNFPDPKSMKSFWQFDHHFTAPVHGFDGAQDYYDRCSSSYFLAGIDKPVAIIHSSDDPFMTLAALPQKNQLPPSVTLDLQQRGGHVGFIGSCQWRLNSWLEARIGTHLRRMGFF